MRIRVCAFFKVDDRSFRLDGHGHCRVWGFMIRYRITTLLLLVMMVAMGLAWRADRNALQLKIDVHESRELLGDLKQCNQNELSWFNENWPQIHATLQRLANSGHLKRMPKREQQALWEELTYLQGCRHPDIMRNHGDDILRILYEFGLTEQVEELKQMFPNVK